MTDHLRKEPDRTRENVSTQELNETSLPDISKTQDTSLFKFEAHHPLKMSSMGFKAIPKLASSGFNGLTITQMDQESARRAGMAQAIPTKSKFAKKEQEKERENSHERSIQFAYDNVEITQISEHETNPNKGTEDSLIEEV
jgi:hypothetical protein